MAKKKVVESEVSKSVDVLDEALALQESLDTTGDCVSLTNDERNELQTEISEELAAMAGNTETAAIPDSSEEIPKPVSTVSTPVTEAKEVAKEIGLMVAGGSEMILGRDYGVTENAIDKWADSMAPLLVKYGITDMNMLKEMPEIQAGVGCFALGMGIMFTRRQYKLEDAAKAKALKEEAAQHGNQPQQ